MGHQAYPHKVLTGRRDELGSIRQYGGLAPFCSREESEHDIMGAGHASTAASYAVGIKEAMRRRSEIDGNADSREDEGRVVAVVGDGAMTGGVAFEALHNAGGLETPIVIVLNDNGMSISPNVGALSRYFNRIRLDRKGYAAREAFEERLTRLPAGIGRRIERLGPQLKESLKAFWAPGLFFEELDLAYVGVVDGHDVKALRRALRQALDAERPIVVHIRTVKGKGFAPAEDGGLEGMEKWHAAKPGSIKDGQATDGAARRRSRPPPHHRLSAPVHGGLRPRAGGGGTPRSARDRHHRRDVRRNRPVGALQGAAGPVLRRRHRRAARGAVRRRPRARGHEACCRHLLDVPSTRLRPDHPRRRATEAERRVLHGSSGAGRRRRPHAPWRIRHLVPAPDPEHRRNGAARRGDAGPDASHGPLYDDGPIALRYPRGNAVGVELPSSPQAIEIGRGEILAEGDRVALLGYGTGVQIALATAELLRAQGVAATVCDARFVKPLDADLIASLAAEHDLLATVEENVLAGGFGSAVVEQLADSGAMRRGLRVMRFGIPDR